jgi:hypothetical protein
VTAKAGKGAERKAPKAPEGPLRSRQVGASRDAKDREDADDPGLPEAPEGVELVPLERLEGRADEDEVSQTQGSEPEQDSPGDTAVLEQEELYEGISSDEEPDEKRKGH